jgi:hypothetical protein
MAGITRAEDLQVDHGFKQAKLQSLGLFFDSDGIRPMRSCRDFYRRDYDELRALCRTPSVVSTLWYFDPNPGVASGETASTASGRKRESSVGCNSDSRCRPGGGLAAVFSAGTGFWITEVKLPKTRDD